MTRSVSYCLYLQPGNKFATETLQIKGLDVFEHLITSSCIPGSLNRYSRGAILPRLLELNA
jgi:hypothetical protein